MLPADIGGVDHIASPVLFGGTRGFEGSLEASGGVILADLNIVESVHQSVELIPFLSLNQLLGVVFDALHELTSHELVVVTVAAIHLLVTHVASHETSEVDGLSKGIDGLLREGASLDTLAEGHAELKDGHLAVAITVQVNAVVEGLSRHGPVDLLRWVCGHPAGVGDALDLLSPVLSHEALDATEGHLEAVSGVFLGDGNTVESLHEFLKTLPVLLFNQLADVLVGALAELTSHEGTITAEVAIGELLIIHVAHHETSHVDVLAEGVNGLHGDDASLYTVIEGTDELKERDSAVFLTVGVNAVVERLSGHVPVLHTGRKRRHGAIGHGSAGGRGAARSAWWARRHGAIGHGGAGRRRHGASGRRRHGARLRRRHGSALELDGTGVGTDECESE